MDTQRLLVKNVNQHVKQKKLRELELAVRSGLAEANK